MDDIIRTSAVQWPDAIESHLLRVSAAFAVHRVRYATVVSADTSNRKCLPFVSSTQARSAILSHERAACYSTNTEGVVSSFH